MNEKIYYSKKDHSRLGIILAEMESESEPGKFYEIRTSDADGKTYCTCKGWVMELNRMRRRGEKGECQCKHIREYRSLPAAKPIVVHDFESFASVRRGIPIRMNNATVSDEVKVKRA